MKYAFLQASVSNAGTNAHRPASVAGNETIFNRYAMNTDTAITR
jgi:hypothetical protein